MTYNFKPFSREPKKHNITFSPRDLNILAKMLMILGEMEMIYLKEITSYYILGAFFESRLSFFARTKSKKISLTEAEIFAICDFLEEMPVKMDSYSELFIIKDKLLRSDAAGNTAEEIKRIDRINNEPFYLAAEKRFQKEKLLEKSQNLYHSLIAASNAGIKEFEFEKGITHRIVEIKIDADYSYIKLESDTTIIFFYKTKPPEIIEL